jgi:hypothetical protein
MPGDKTLLRFIALFLSCAAFQQLRLCKAFTYAPVKIFGTLSHLLARENQVQKVQYHAAKSLWLGWRVWAGLFQIVNDDLE